MRLKMFVVAATVAATGWAASEHVNGQAPQGAGPAPAGAAAGQPPAPQGRGGAGGGGGRGGRGGQAVSLVPNPDRPFLRTPDGKPDMNGVFSAAGGGGRGGEPISYQPWAEARRKYFQSRNLADEPAARCLSPGILSLTTVSFFPLQFVQIPGQMVILYEWDHFFRVIPIDGRKQKTLDEIDTLQSLGHSVGHWEGDTLVVDVLGLSDYTWIGGSAGVHSDQMHIVERYRMIDRDTIEYRAVLEDPVAWTKPWSTGTVLKRRPAGDELMEYNCAENNKLDDLPPPHTQELPGPPTK